MFSLLQERVTSASWKWSWLREGLGMLVGSVVLALSAQVAISVGWSPVPLTLQLLVVMLIGALCGAKRGGGTVALYLIEGLSGLPVFAGGHSGLFYFCGPTGGYLVGFLLAAVLVGYGVRQWGTRWPVVWMIMALGTMVVYGCGIGYLARFIGWESAFVAGCLPFVVGDVLKFSVAATLVALGARSVRWLNLR